MSTTASDLSRGRLRALLARLVLPADDWAQTHKTRITSPLLVLMSVLLVILCLSGFVGILLTRQGAEPELLLGGLLLLLAIGCAIVGVLMYQVQHYLLEPLFQLRVWALSMCNGDLSVRIPSPQRGEFVRLAYHINRLSDALDKLVNEMDELVRSQTERLQQKNRSLEILYEVAATINTSRDLDDLLERSAEKLMDMVNAQAATVCLRGEHGHMRLNKSIGFEADGIDGKPLWRDEGSVNAQAHVPDDKDPMPDKVVIGASSVAGQNMGLIMIPLKYQSKSLGVYRLFTPTPEVAEVEEIRKLLASVGKHLGMAIEKARLDKEGQNLSIMRERTSLAHELHDSLAQTLVSLRFQVKMLSETLERTEVSAAVARIQNGLDEAHKELRELLANFRAPIDKRGLLPALEDMVARFRRESGIATYLQTECQDLELSAASEKQVLRIVREALTNVRKHSHAQTARVLLRRDSVGNCRVLIEDDGVGIGAPVLEGHPGEHMGLSIMQERARCLDGDLRIESDPGEGTQVLLSFNLNLENEQHQGPAHTQRV